MEPPLNIYQRLSAERVEIRLLALKPAQQHDPIHVSLSIVSLNDKPQFEALSYVWGNHKARLPIVVCDSDTTVTENLADALRRMRQTHDVRTLWVDAICIDQTNVAERNSQVSLMGRIYSECLKVLVWLGPEDETTKSAIAVAEEVAMGKHYIRSECRFDGRTCGNDVKILDTLLRRPWWTRSWTLQEIVLAGKVDMFCGSLQLDWETLVQAHDNMEKHRVTCCLAPLCMECLAGIKFFANVVTGISVAQRSFKSNGGMYLLNVLARHRARKATDPRDKIFGCLGLVPADQARLIMPDYEASIEHVYCQTIIFDINWRGSLDSLDYASDNECTSDTALPSWVADWTSIPKDEFLPAERQARYKLYNASNGLKSNPLIYDNKILSVPSVLVDQVHIVGDLMDPLSCDDILIETLVRWKDILRFDEAPDQQYITGGSLADAFWRTLIVDVVFNPTTGSEPYIRATPEDKETFTSWWNMLVDSRQLLPSLMKAPSFQRIHRAIIPAIANRRFFTTTRGFIGNGPPRIRPGDDIYVLAGSHIPFALRKDERVVMIPPDSKPLHTLVGGCYLHGTMDGQMVAHAEGKIIQLFIL
jgi:Heterokaryon incompatibility protein (HET)